MRLTRTQEAARQRIFGLRGSQLNAAEIAAEIAAALQPAIGFDGYRTFAVEGATGAIERLLAASAEDADQRRIYLRDTYGGSRPEFLGPLGLNRPFAELPRCFAVRPTLAECHGVARDIRMHGDERAYAAAYHESADMYRGLVEVPGGMLHATFMAGTTPVAVMHLNRITRWSAPFSATHVAFMALMSAPIGEVLADALRADVVRERRGLPDGSGIVLIGRDGRIDYASPAGTAWIRTLGQVETDLATGLPTSLWSAIAGLRAAGALDGPAAGTGPVRRVGFDGGRVRIESTPGSGPDQFAIVITSEAVAASDTVPILPDLTPAETRIVRLVLDGLGNREIAERLFLSEHTVEWHLGHVYGKLGVRNRAQLVRRHREPA